MMKRPHRDTRKPREFLHSIHAGKNTRASRCVRVN
jgi:hypothetical protein